MFNLKQPRKPAEYQSTKSYGYMMWIRPFLFMNGLNQPIIFAIQCLRLHLSTWRRKSFRQPRNINRSSVLLLQKCTVVSRSFFPSSSYFFSAEPSTKLKPMQIHQIQCHAHLETIDCGTLFYSTVQFAIQRLHQYPIHTQSYFSSAPRRNHGMLCHTIPFNCNG